MKTSSARKPPKILLLGPPCSKKSEIAQIISRKFNICNISISDLLNKEIKSQNDNSTAILESMNKGDLVSEKYVFKLLEDRLYASDCMINGWILTGFPKNSAQMNYLENTNSSFKPSYVFIIELEKEFTEKRSNLRKIDPATGKVYYTDNKDLNNIENVNLVKRLVTKTEDKSEVFLKR